MKKLASLFAALVLMLALAAPGAAAAQTGRHHLYGGTHPRPPRPRSRGAWWRPGRIGWRERWPRVVGPPLPASRRRNRW